MNMKKRMLSMGAAILMLAGMSAMPTFAQDKMSSDKMGGGKMAGDKMAGSKTGGGKMSGDAMMSKATMGLSDAQKQYVTMKMSKMSASDKMAMEKKLAGYSTSTRKGQVTQMMNKDKMAGGKMSGDKMDKGGKMSGDKMDKGGKM